MMVISASDITARCSISFQRLHSLRDVISEAQITINVLESFPIIRTRKSKNMISKFLEELMKLLNNYNKFNM